MLKETCMKCCEDNWNRMILPVISICEGCPSCSISERNQYKSDYVCKVGIPHLHLATKRLRDGKKGKAGEIIQSGSMPEKCTMILEHSLLVGDDGRESIIKKSKETYEQLSRFNAFRNDGKFYCVYYDKNIEEHECLYSNQRG